MIIDMRSTRTGLITCVWFCWGIHKLDGLHWADGLHKLVPTSCRRPQLSLLVARQLSTYFQDLATPSKYLIYPSALYASYCQMQPCTSRIVQELGIIVNIVEYVRNHYTSVVMVLLLLSRISTVASCSSMSLVRELVWNVVLQDLVRWWGL